MLVLKGDFKKKQLRGSHSNSCFHKLCTVYCNLLWSLFGSSCYFLKASEVERRVKITCEDFKCHRIILD